MVSIFQMLRARFHKCGDASFGTRKNNVEHRSCNTNLRPEIRVVLLVNVSTWIHACIRPLAVMAAGYLMMGIWVPIWISIIDPMVASVCRKRAATRAPICVLYSV
jgi:hypothetical protein